MLNINQLKSLPKVEVSFQDDFSGSQREYTLTPIYILGELEKNGIKPKIGDEILLWEKDEDKNNQEYYLCNIGKLKILKENLPEIDISSNKIARIDNNPVFIEINREGYFDLPRLNYDEKQL